MKAYLGVEKTKIDFLSNENFTAGRDEYYPIPQREIDFAGGLYIQKPDIKNKVNSNVCLG